MKLLYYGFKYPDEFMWDYVRRLSDINGFNNPKKLEKYIMELGKENVEYDQYITRYSIYKAGLEILLGRNISYDGSDRIRLHVDRAWDKQAKVCESCIEENDYIRFYWRVRDYSKCHYHGDKLVYSKARFRSKDIMDVERRYIYQIVKGLLSKDGCQDKIIDEFERFQFDLALIEGIERGLYGYSEWDLDYNKTLHALWRGKYVGLHVDERIEAIAKDLGHGASIKDYLIRIISLMVCNPRREGFYCRLPWRSIHKEYRKYCMYYIGVDNDLSQLILGIKDLPFKEIDKIPIETILGSDFKGGDNAKRNCQLVVYYCRLFESWISDTNSMFAVRDRKRKPSLYNKYIKDKARNILSV